MHPQVVPEPGAAQAGADDLLCAAMLHHRQDLPEVAAEDIDLPAERLADQPRVLLGEVLQGAVHGFDGVALRHGSLVPEDEFGGPKEVSQRASERDAAQHGTPASDDCMGRVVTTVVLCSILRCCKHSDAVAAASPGQQPRGGRLEGGLTHRWIARRGRSPGS